MQQTPFALVCMLSHCQQRESAAALFNVGHKSRQCKMIPRSTDMLALSCSGGRAGSRRKRQRDC